VTALPLEVGAIVASATPARLQAILGSCVMVCLHDPEARVGGACHFLVPGRAPDPGAAGRYGDDALPALVRAVERAGGTRARLQAKVFGAVLIAGAPTTLPAVPAANALCALAWCTRAGIPVVAHRLGGLRPLEVLFATDHGGVRVRAVAAASADARAGRAA